eukprot:scaffold8154_cov112-Isochrysis_galbana.AAC.4
MHSSAASPRRKGHYSAAAAGPNSRPETAVRTPASASPTLDAPTGCDPAVLPWAPMAPQPVSCPRRRTQEPMACTACTVLGTLWASRSRKME